MRPEIQIKINNDHKQKEFLHQNSYWYKELNRSALNYKEFYSSFKANKRNEKVTKANSFLETIDTVNTILKILK